MKQLWKWSFVALLLSITVGCGGDDYNDAELREEIARLEARLAAAETVLNAYARNLFITSVTQNANGYEIRYTTTGGATTTPKKAVGSGITIIENRYENGQGRMVFSEALTEIGEQAFAAHATLLTVELPEGLQRVGKKSFNNCTKLIDAVIPSTVDAINDYAFSGCALRKVTIKGSPSIGQYAFSNSKSLAAFYGPSATTDHRAILQPDRATFAAYAMASGDSYEVPNGIRTIGATAFANCGTLTSVSLPDGVTTIEAYAFYYNFALSTINLPEGITAIGEYAFMGCQGLKALTLPTSLKQLGKGVFRGASALATLTVLATTPPTLDTGVFAACPTTMQIAVPASVVEQYKVAAGWSDYAAQIVAIK